MEDKVHLGRYFLEKMRKRNPEEICIIDAGTGEESTVGTVLRRSVQLARGFSRLGLQPGDVLALSGTNHVELRLPYYAALMTGLPVAGVDPMYKPREIRQFLEKTQAKIVFCQIENYDIYKLAIQELGISAKIVTFGGAETSLGAFIAEYDSGDPIEDYQATDFDSHSVYAWLMSTSGSTGLPKLAAYTHRHLINITRQWAELQGITDENAKNKRVLINSPPQWLSGFIQLYGPVVMGACIVQSSKPNDTEHLIDIINKYKPTSMATAPGTHAHILQHKKDCNYESFDVICVGGSKVHTATVSGLQAKMRNDAAVKELYGQTETGYFLLASTPTTPVGSCRPLHSHKMDHAIKLVNTDTGKEVTEPFQHGELWWKGPRFDAYFNSPEETSRVFADGWLKTGDIFYFDENGNYFFVERIQMLIKCRGYTIPPPELEEVILTHHGVKFVAVTKIPHDTDGEHPVACIVRRHGATVTAEESINLVASTLSETKQLRGGVIFMEDFPKTSTGKVARKELEEIVKEKATNGLNKKENVRIPTKRL